MGGAYLMLSVGAACPGLLETNPGLHQIVLGAFGLPFGLLMVVMSGTELSTGNYAVVTMALLEGRATKAELIKNWSLSFLGNLVGSLGFVLLVYFGNTLGASPAASKIAVVKTSLPFGVAFVRGIMCNWLVCMAVYLASFAKDAIGKLVPIWFCISAFIALGLEHSVANMFIVPLGILQGAPGVTSLTFVINNLIPVTLGNIVGGAVCVAAGFAKVYGKTGKH